MTKDNIKEMFNRWPSSIIYGDPSVKLKPCFTGIIEEDAAKILLEVVHLREDVEAIKKEIGYEENHFDCNNADADDGISWLHNRESTDGY